MTAGRALGSVLFDNLHDGLPNGSENVKMDSSRRYS
jgi:hypothetical protein